MSALDDILRMSRRQSPVDQVLGLAASFSLDRVRDAWQEEESDRRDQVRQANSGSYPVDEDYTELCWRYVKEVWSDFLIIDDEDSAAGLVKVPYTVDDNGNPKFGDEQPVKVEYTAISASSESFGEALRLVVQSGAPPRLSFDGVKPEYGRYSTLLWEAGSWRPRRARPL